MLDFWKGSWSDAEEGYEDRIKYRMGCFSGVDVLVGDFEHVIVRCPPVYLISMLCWYMKIVSKAL